MARLIQTSVDLVPSLQMHHCDRTGHDHIVAALYDLGRRTRQGVFTAVADSGEYYNTLYLNELGDVQLLALYDEIIHKDGCLVASEEITLVLRARARFRRSLPPRSLLQALLMNQIRKNFEEISDGRMYHGVLLKHFREQGFETEMRPVILAMLKRRERKKRGKGHTGILQAKVDTDRII